MGTPAGHLPPPPSPRAQGALCKDYIYLGTCVMDYLHRSHRSGTIHQPQELKDTNLHSHPASDPHTTPHTHTHTQPRPPAHTALHTCARRRSHPSAALPGGPERGGGKAGDFYACLYLMNHMQMRQRMCHKRVSPQRLWQEGHKGLAFLSCPGVLHRLED